MDLEKKAFELEKRVAELEKKIAALLDSTPAATEAESYFETRVRKIVNEEFDNFFHELALGN